MAVVLVVACDRGTKASGAECSATASAIVKAASSEPPSTDKPVIADVAKRCTDDHWTVEARNCLAAIKTTDGLHDCSYKHLTQEQQDKLQRALGDLTTSTALNKMEYFTDKMCACKDAKCAQDVSDEMTKWAREQARSQRERPKMSDDQMKRAAEIGERMSKCMSAAMAPSGDGADEALVKLAEFKDKMCVCKDAACAQKVSDEMTAWSQEQAKREPTKMSEEQTKRAAAIGDEMGKCMQVAMQPGTPKKH